MKRITPVIAACLFIAACGIDDSKEQKTNATVVTQPQQTIAATGSDTSNPAVPAPATSTPTPEQILSYDQVADTVNTQVFRGLLMYKNGKGSFVDCNTQKVFKVIDATGTLEGKYESFSTKSDPLYAELVGKLSSSKTTGYSRIFRVTHMNKLLLKLPPECDAAKGGLEALKRKPL